MLEVFLKDPGIIFTKNNGKVVRTPIKFYIKESEKLLYESMIRASSINNFEITEIDEVPNKSKGNVPNLSKIKPKSDINLEFKVKG